MNRVFAVSLSQDLTEFAAFLWDNEIPHRIIEREDSQELWVASSINTEQIQKLYDMWQNGQDLAQIQVVKQGQERLGISETAKQAPLTCLLIVASIFATFLTAFGSNELLNTFTFTDFRYHSGILFVKGVIANITSLELWRFITPMLIHFSLAHIGFNLLWVWIIGTRMEIMQGYKALLWLVLFSALLSNLGQYIVSGPMFGGMSGVVFALLGYAWLWDKRNPDKPFGLPPALMGLMLVWLLLGYTGVLEGLGFGAIANTAHLVGMVAGLLFVPIGMSLAKGKTK